MLKKDIKQAGLTITSSRLKILKLLESRKEKHLTAEDIHRKLTRHDESISMGTVYRVLTQFEKAGLVVRRQFEKGPAYYEIEKGDHHSHLVCVHCNKITEFLDKQLDAKSKKIAKAKGYDLLHHSVVLYVACDDCQAARRSVD